MNRKLTIVHGQGAGTVYNLDVGEHLIGRKDEVEGFFPEIDLQEFDEVAKISRKHAKIIVTEETAIIEDLDSLNGTYVNQLEEAIKVGASKELKSGDEVNIGSIVLRFEEE